MSYDISSWADGLKDKMADLKKRQLATIIVLFFAFLLYSVVWSYISIMKLYSLNASVYDLGQFMQAFWNAYHSNSVYNVYTTVLTYGDVYLFFPFVYIQSYPLLLSVQSILLGVAIFPIFGIAKHFLKSELTSLLISLSYLIYFPLVGLNWFDFHTDALFVPFFLLGYYFYIKGRYKLSFFFFLLASIGRYPEAFLVAIFGLLTIIEDLFHKYSQNKLVRVGEYKFLVSITAAASTLMILGYVSLKTYATITLSNLPLTSNLENKIFTVLLVFVPMMMIPVFSKKWLILLIPYFYAMFTTNVSQWVFPYFTHYQMTSILIPFIFIGTVEGMYALFGSNHSNLNTNNDERFPVKRKIFRKIRSIKPDKKVAVAIFTAVILFSLVYEPFGPYNQFSQTDFNLSSILEANMTLYEELNYIAGMIPNGNPYVLTDNQIPQVFPRPQEHNAPMLVIPSTIAYNMTYQSVNGTWQKPRIDYVLMYTLGWGFTQSFAYPYNGTAYDITQRLWETGNYGMLAEASGIVLMEKNYTGKPELYIPLHEYFSADYFYLGSGAYRNGSDISVTDTGTASQTYSQAWGGPFTYLPPGHYIVTFQLETTNRSPSNYIDLVISDHSYGASLPIPLASEDLKGTDFSKTNTVTNISLSFSIGYFAEDIEFRGDYANWNGTLTLKGVNVKQVGFYSGYSSSTIYSENHISKDFLNIVPQRLKRILLIPHSYVTLRDSSL